MKTDSQTKANNRNEVTPKFTSGSKKSKSTGMRKRVNSAKYPGILVNPTRPTGSEPNYLYDIDIAEYDEGAVN